MQDNIHLANKLKNRLFDSANNLEIGDFCATINHVRMILDDSNYTSNDHLLNSSDVNTNDSTRDKMNFESTKKICTDEVINILSENIEGSQGTVAYIKIIRSILKAYIDVDVDPITRLYHAYFAVSFVRRWKSDLDYDVNENNFVTSNIWTCMELNFASLLNLVLKGQGDMVLIWNSQSCEELFRSLRSISSFGLTEINFNLLEGLEKINRVHKIQVLSHELKNIFQLPENLKKKSDRSVLNIKVEQPSREDCKMVLEKASNDALELCKRLKMKKYSECDPSKYLNSTQTSRRKTNVLSNIENDEDTSIVKVKNMFFVDDDSGKNLKLRLKMYLIFFLKF